MVWGLMLKLKRNSSQGQCHILYYDLSLFHYHLCHFKIYIKRIMRIVCFIMIKISRRYDTSNGITWEIFAFKLLNQMKPDVTFYKTGSSLLSPLFQVKCIHPIYLLIQHKVTNTLTPKVALSKQ